MKPEEAYELLKSQVKDQRISHNSLDLVKEIYLESIDELKTYNKVSLISKVPTKRYISFEHSGKETRAINEGLFTLDKTLPLSFLENVPSKTVQTVLSASEITKAVYCIAMSFCAYIDITKSNDQKTPGTWFEYLMGILIAFELEVEPINAIQVLNMDLETSLTTDFIFNLGTDKAKFHVPIKTSTRERVIQVWAHQRVIDGVYGVGRFRCLLMCLAETKKDRRKKEVVEICLPNQWMIYQLFISQLTRVYYLDLPDAYIPLGMKFPPLHVKQFGEFYYELTALCS